VNIEWIPLLVALAAALPGLYAAWRQRNLTDANATARIAETAIGLLDDLREENVQLKNERRNWYIERQTLHETLMSCMAKCRMMEAERAIGKAVAGEENGVE